MGILDGTYTVAENEQTQALYRKQALKEAFERDHIGRFTASEFHRLMTCQKDLDVLPAGAKTFAREKAAEILTGRPSNEDFSNAYTDWGKRMESDTVREFTERTGIVVDNTGDEQQFITGKGRYKDEELGYIKWSNHVGCTPDGLIGAYEGLEGKAKTSKVHLKYLLDIQDADSLKEKAPEIYWQIMGCLWLTNRRTWFFVSYDPRYKDANLRLLFVEIKRNEPDIYRLMNRVKLAINEKKMIIEKVKTNAMKRKVKL